MFDNLNDVEFVIFDVETTGLDPKSGDRIIEIAAVRLKAGKEIRRFYSLINPKRPISPAAFEVNHISDDMVKQAPDSSSVLPKFLEFIKGSCLAAYNTNFDLEFINNEIQPLGLCLPTDIPTIDILIMARRLLPELGRYSLLFVAQSLGINITQTHRALLDVKLTINVFNKFVDILNKKQINDFANFLNLFGINRKINDSFNEQKITTVQKAIDLNTKLKIRYFSLSRADVSEREVSPKSIKEEKSKRFLVGFCHLRNEERSFRLDRILHMEML